MSDSSYTHLRAVVYLSEAEGQSVERISRLRTVTRARPAWQVLVSLTGPVGNPVGEGMTHFDIAEDQSESKTWTACKPRQRCREPKIVALT
jgi:hypothetical protein